MIGDRGRRLALGADAHGQRLETLQHHPGVERAHRGAGLADEILQMVGQELFRAEHGAAETAALAVDVLGRRVDDDVGAVRERPLQERRREDVVDDGQRADLAAELGDGGDVDEVERRVGRRLEEERLGVGAHGLAPGLEVAAVDQGRGDAEARTERLDDVAAGAEHGAGGDDVVAGLEEGKERGGDGGHAGRGRARDLGALEQAKALLEHGDGGIAEAGVLVARVLVLEAGLGLLGARVDVALGEEEGFGGLAELGAEHAAVDELGVGMPGRGVGRGRLFLGHALSSARA